MNVTIQKIKPRALNQYARKTRGKFLH